MSSDVYSIQTHIVHSGSVKYRVDLTIHQWQEICGSDADGRHGMTANFKECERIKYWMDGGSRWIKQREADVPSDVIAIAEKLEEEINS